MWGSLMRIKKERVGPEAKPYVKVQKARKNEVQ